MSDGSVKLLQGVREVFEVVDTDGVEAGGKGKIVLIGKGVDKKTLQRSLEEGVLG